MAEIKHVIADFLSWIEKFRQKSHKLHSLQSLLRNLEQKYAEALEERIELESKLNFIHATINMPELVLDQEWHILNNSHSFLHLTNTIVDFSQNQRHLKDFLQEGDFDKIQEYQDRVNALEHLPYDKGEKWQLRYGGPNLSEKIGKDWILHEDVKNDSWSICRKDGIVKITHDAHSMETRDCYLMFHEGMGGAEEDIKISYRIKTSAKENATSDVSVVITGTAGDKSRYPDLFGYTGCTGSSFNTEARLQRQGVNLVTVPEVLKPDNEYLVVCERTGGRLTRKLKDLKTGQEMNPLKTIDSNAIYHLNNHFGFTTYAGDLDVYDVQVFTRKSMFPIEQFKIPFYIEVGLRDEKVADRIFRLRIGRDVIHGKLVRKLMFDDITERKKIENELRKSREQLQHLASHLQLVREEERARIAREIHDELGQALTALQLDLHRLKKMMPPDQKILVEKTDQMMRLIDNTNLSVRRISTYLRPALLDDLGLTAAIEWQLEDFQKRTGIECQSELLTECSDLEEDLITAVFRIFQEALTNIARHADATKISALLAEKEDDLILTVKDNGKGITDDQVNSTRAFGVIGMRERLFPWDGTVEISGTQGKGTVVSVRIPLNKKGRLG